VNVKRSALGATKLADSASHTTTIKQAAADLGVSPKWVRDQIAQSTITPQRHGGKRNGRFVLSAEDVETLRAKATEVPAGDDSTALARVTELETQRANLLARVAWERAIAQTQQKALEDEKARSERLEAELALQRTRVEQLKALSVMDRVMGRHKSI
jgi:hypothetical protein